MNKIISLLALLLSVESIVFSQGTIEASQVGSHAWRATGIDDQGNVAEEFAHFGVEFTVTARNGSVYLDRSITFSSLFPIPGSGFNWSASQNSSTIVNLQGDNMRMTLANEAEHLYGEYWKIDSGETVEFELVVQTDLHPQISGFYGVSLNSINWTTSPSQTPINFLTLNGFDSGLIYLQAIPEPSTLAIGAFGIGALFLFRRK